MNNLADAVLDYLWWLEFSEEDEVDFDLALKLEQDLLLKIDTKFSAAEKQALQEAARRRLAWWLQEPDEYGYTPRKLLQSEQKAFLGSIAVGNFTFSDGQGEGEELD